MPSELEIIPITLKQAAAFIAEQHRHHGPPRGQLGEAPRDPMHDRCRGCGPDPVARRTTSPGPGGYWFKPVIGNGR